MHGYGTGGSLAAACAALVGGAEPRPDWPRPSRGFCAWSGSVVRLGGRYPDGMSALKARVASGRLKLEEPTDLPAGQTIELVPFDEVISTDGDDLDGAERAAILPKTRRCLRLVLLSGSAAGQPRLRMCRASDAGVQGSCARRQGSFLLKSCEGVNVIGTRMIAAPPSGGAK